MWMGGLVNNGGRLMRRALLGALIAVVAPVPFSEASTRSCRALEAQLAGLASGGGRASAAQTRRYDEAITRQQQQIQKARTQARQAGCGAAVSGRSVQFCASLNATMQRMQGNLADLQKQRSQRAGGGDTRRERARINAALDANGCRGATIKRVPEREARTREPAETQMNTRANTPTNPRANQGVVINGNRISVGGLTGRFRTMCVRTCDGYYFPISSSSKESEFTRDQNACQSMCPGTHVELHYHRLQGQEAEEMVSAATGLPYRQLPNALRYRQTNASTPPSCGCNAATTAASRGFEVIGGNYGGKDDEQAAASVGEQTAALPADADSEASPEPASAEGRKRGPALPLRRGMDDILPPASPDRGVRVVGPVFLPDPEEARDPQAPAPARDQ